MKGTGKGRDIITEERGLGYLGERLDGERCSRPVEGGEGFLYRGWGRAVSKGITGGKKVSYPRKNS